MTDKKLPRGERNRNPGNIRKSKDKWQGLAKEQPDSAFFTFTDATYGIRAIARIVIKYQDDYNLNTVRGIIDRWAPPIENDTEAYIAAVARKMGVGTNEEINVHDFQYLYPLVEAIIKHENGRQPYTEAQITKGLVLAGVEPEKKSLAKSKTVQASTAAGAITLASMGAEAVEKAAPAFSLAERIASDAPFVLGLIVLAAIAYVIWDRIEDRKKGLR